MYIYSIFNHHTNYYKIYSSLTKIDQKDIRLEFENFDKLQEKQLSKIWKILKYTPNFLESLVWKCFYRKPIKKAYPVDILIERFSLIEV